MNFPNILYIYYIGYLISRILFEEEMIQISNIYESISEHDNESITWLLNRTIHNYKSFSYRVSTPSSIVGKIFYNVFFSRCKIPVSILTSKVNISFEKNVSKFY